MINPSKQGEFLNSPTERASKINDPQFQNNEGYFAYDLTHSEFISPRFGEITPSCHLDVVSGDRIVVSDNTKLIRNQIDGNLLSTINQYNDSFFVSLRNVMPMNYEKLLPNPVHGDDIPNAALPQVPLLGMLRDYLYYGKFYILDDGNIEQDLRYSTIMDDFLSGDITLSDLDQTVVAVIIGRLATVATVLSRGQLLDYLGYNLDYNVSADKNHVSMMQADIDEWFDVLYKHTLEVNDSITGLNLDLTKDGVESNAYNSGKLYFYNDIFSWRDALSSCLESGRFPIFTFDINEIEALSDKTFNLIYNLNSYILNNDVLTDISIYDHLDQFNEQAEPFADGYYMNIGKILAYQQIVAEYYTNDHVDNVFSSELYMENLRSVMYPVDFREGVSITREPVFEYNGRAVEYDYISYGGFWTSLCSDAFEGKANRQHVWMTLMLLLRRSLRYGDYFATSRPHMLAISDQLSINVENGQVSPIDVTKNLLLQRYLNAANYIGQGFVQYMASMYGVKPSDTGHRPRFVSHKKIVIGNQITNNTANNQGAQTTNLIGLGEKQSMDVFCDDFGYLITLVSFDTLPVYDRGIDSTYHFADRFDYFNPMMQNIGDQPIRVSELMGNPALYNDTFGWTMRNAEYKYKLSKTHGAFVNSLPGYLIHYPLEAYIGNGSIDNINIDPDFIRDKPIYLDRVLKSTTGTSPADYYHFIISVVNEVKAARKITATPSVLF